MWKSLFSLLFLLLPGRQRHRQIDGWIDKERETEKWRCLHFQGSNILSVCELTHTGAQDGFQDFPLSLQLIYVHSFHF